MNVGKRWKSPPERLQNVRFQIRAFRVLMKSFHSSKPHLNWAGLWSKNNLKHSPIKTQSGAKARKLLQWGTFTKGTYREAPKCFGKLIKASALRRHRVSGLKLSARLFRKLSGNGRPKLRDPKLRFADRPHVIDCCGFGSAALDRPPSDPVTGIW